ncbi:MAG: peptidylprolyl isomerase [bacterium]
MKVKALLLLLPILLVMPSVSRSHVKFSDAERMIIRLQDERRGIETIAKFLDAKEEKVAWRAAVALANIGDTNSRVPLIARLNREARPYVIDGIAFALGVLKSNKNSYAALLKCAEREPSEQVYIGLGRTVSKDELSNLATFVNDRKAAPRIIASLLVELGLRNMLTEAFAQKVDDLEKENDPQVRWRAIYSFTRTDDSVLLSNHLTEIKEYLYDVGSAESRMYAATALGKIHNDEASKILLTAARSETEWRVRVNIFNAIAKQSHFTSAIHEVLKKAVQESTADSNISNHVARAALDAIDAMLVAGKVSSPDSLALEDWLAEYEPSKDLHGDQSSLIRSQCMIPLGRLHPDKQRIKEIASLFLTHDRNSNMNSSKALGGVHDTLAFMNLFRNTLISTPNEVHFALDGLNEFWINSKKDSALYADLSHRRFINLYATTLLHFPSLSYDPAIVTRALEFVRDTALIPDSTRDEASQSLIQYCSKFDYPQYHDQLLSLIGTITWMKPSADTFKVRLAQIYDEAISKWGDQAIADSAYKALQALHVSGISHQIAKVVRDTIDWNLIERLPDTMVIQSNYDFIFIKLNTFETPLTALNMYKLAKLNWFANNFIHRLVPNFVIQSGDLTGTGDGGPDHSIRTEIAPLQYDKTGVVGMASSGKDTEGSQWFITHCPTPHLNTRYTIWGEVAIGVEKIEKFQLNERIENIIAHR